MSQTFDCPSCGAPLELEPDEDDNLVRCIHCGKNVVVPETLRRKKDPQPPIQTIPAVQVITVNPGVTWETTKPVRAGRWVSCLVVFIIVFVGGTIIASVAAPLLFTGIFAALFGDGTDIVQGIIATQVSSDQPGLQITMPVIPTVMSLIPEDTGFASKVLEFGAEGTGPGYFDDTRSVAVDGDGNIYTAEYSDHRVQKFDSEGKFLLGWIAEGSNPLMDMAVSRTGTVYVVTTGEVYKYDAEGKPQGMLPNPDDEYMEYVSITPDNGLVIASRDKIYRLNSSEEVTLVIDQPYSAASDNGSIEGRVVVDGLGNLYALIQYVQTNKFKDAVFVFDANGKYTNRFGSEGEDPGEFRAAQTLVLDGEGRVYVSDIKGIQVFSPEGAYQGLIDVEGAAFGLWFDDAGALYVASSADRIFKFEINE